MDGLGMVELKLYTHVPDKNGTGFTSYVRVSLTVHEEDAPAIVKAFHEGVSTSVDEETLAKFLADELA